MNQYEFTAAFPNYNGYSDYQRSISRAKQSTELDSQQILFPKKDINDFLSRPSESYDFTCQKPHADNVKEEIYQKRAEHARSAKNSPVKNEIEFLRKQVDALKIVCLMNGIPTPSRPPEVNHILKQFKATKTIDSVYLLKLTNVQITDSNQLENYETPSQHDGKVILMELLSLLENNSSTSNRPSESLLEISYILYNSSFRTYKILRELGIPFPDPSTLSRNFGPIREEMEKNLLTEEGIHNNICNYIESYHISSFPFHINLAIDAMSVEPTFIGKQSSKHINSVIPEYKIGKMKYKVFDNLKKTDPLQHAIDILLKMDEDEDDADYEPTKVPPDISNWLKYCIPEDTSLIQEINIEKAIDYLVNLPDDHNDPDYRENRNLRTLKKSLSMNSNGCIIEEIARKLLEMDDDPLDQDYKPPANEIRDIRDWINECADEDSMLDPNSLEEAIKYLINLKDDPNDLNFGEEEEQSIKYVFAIMMLPLDPRFPKLLLRIVPSRSSTLNDEIESIMHLIIQDLDQHGDKTLYISSDGDRFFDKKHLEMFNFYKSTLETSFRSALECVNGYSIWYLSDFLHLFKIACSRLKKRPILIYAERGAEINCIYTNTASEINSKLKLGAPLTDCSQAGKLKDSYPISLFSVLNTLKLLKEDDIIDALYLLSYSLLLEAVRNPIWHKDTRLKLFEICCNIFGFILDNQFQDCRARKTARLHSTKMSKNANKGNHEIYEKCINKKHFQK